MEIFVVEIFIELDYILLQNSPVSRRGIEKLLHHCHSINNTHFIIAICLIRGGGIGAAGAMATPYDHTLID